MQSNKLIAYNNEAPTAWLTLALIVAIVIAFLQYVERRALQDIEALPIIEVAEAIEVAPVITIDTSLEEVTADRRYRDNVLDLLLECESTGDHFAVGDGGDSHGAYQWQKPTLEDILGYSVTYEEYLGYVTDYATIRTLTEHTIFERKEAWRWYNCINKNNPELL